jgi:hypothetical protein
VFTDEAPGDAPTPVDVLPVPALPLTPAVPPLPLPAAPALPPPAPPPPPPWAKALSGKTIAATSAAVVIDLFRHWSFSLFEFLSLTEKNAPSS